jgi:hypothetical protein
VDDGIVHAIFYVGALVPRAAESDIVGVVLGEQQWDLALAIEVIIVQQQVGMVRVDYAVPQALVSVQERLRVAIRPGPSVAEPQGRQHVQHGRLRPPIVDTDPDQQVFGGRFGILHDDIEIAVVIEDTCVDQFIFKRFPRALCICCHEVGIGISCLRILYKYFIYKYFIYECVGVLSR